MSNETQLKPRLMDSLYSRTPESVAQGAFAVLNAVQHIEHPASQVMALACAFRNFCDVLGMDVAETCRIVERMERDCRYRHANTLSAVRKYVEGELLPHFP